jgi:hypothetical protein
MGKRPRTSPGRSAALLQRDTEAAELLALMRGRDAFKNHPGIDELAAATHELLRRSAKGPLAPQVDRPYEQLDPDYQAANRANARRIPDHLALIDFAIEPGPGGDDSSWRAPLEAAIKQHLDRLAQAEHLGWCEERRANGWRYAAVRNDPLKHHPGLVEWSRLSSEDQEKDRGSIRGIPEVLAIAGCRAVRLTSTPPVAAVNQTAVR